MNEEPQANTSTSEPANVDTDTAPISNYFGINDADATQKDKMSSVAQYLRADNKEYDQIDMLRDLKGLLFKLGTPPLGQSQLDMLYNYAKIAGRMAEDNKEIERMMR
jgi:hypothetical protein